MKQVLFIFQSSLLDTFSSSSYHSRRFIYSKLYPSSFFIRLNFGLHLYLEFSFLFSILCILSNFIFGQLPIFLNQIPQTALLFLAPSLVTSIVIKIVTASFSSSRMKIVYFERQEHSLSSHTH